MFTDILLVLFDLSIKNKPVTVCLKIILKKLTELVSKYINFKRNKKVYLNLTQKYYKKNNRIWSIVLLQIVIKMSV